MDPSRWAAVKEILGDALDRSPADRAAFVRARCGADEELRREVDSLLAAEARAGSFGEHLPAPFSATAGTTGQELPQLQPGERIGPYQIAGFVAAGGMGEVYRALDTKLERDVAIKILSSEFAGSADRLGRLAQEARVLATLNHPNIAAIYGLEERGSLCALVLELIEGDTLALRIKDAVAGPSGLGLPLDESLAIARQVAEALSAAHERGVIHRDLKPANVKVRADGSVKVLDFGLAKTLANRKGAPLQSARVATTRTTEGVLVGTPAYMSPEQVRGRPVDARTDVWSFGCVLYEMLTGRQAFSGETVSDVLARILEGEPEPIQKLRRDVPPEVAQLLTRCLEREPDARYASGAELLAAVTASQQRLAAPARAVRMFLRRPSVVASLVGLAIVASVLAASSMNRAARARWVRTEAIPQVQKHAEAGDWEAAYRLAKQAETTLAGDPELAALWPRFSWLIAIPSDPPGARVFRRPYSAADDAWEELGTTPIEAVRVPFGYSVVRLELAGHRPLVRALGFTVEGSQELMRLEAFTLDTPESLADGKVRIPVRPPESAMFDVPTPFRPSRDFFLGRYEVTNREYKQFVDAGGYQQRQFWEYPFVQDGKEIPWEMAMALFRDKTGRPGPSTWEAGDFPDGRGDYPVGGISWYEAAAYARFVGQELPTIHHWRFASSVAGVLSEAWLLPASNLDSNGPAPVGRFRGVTWSGAYDMVGNVREWCLNAVGNSRVIAGGAWSDESAFYRPSMIQSALLPLDRSPANGVRLAVTRDDPETAARLHTPLPEIAPAGAADKPVSEEAYEIYRNMYAYDPAPLNADVEDTETSADWIRERVSFDSSYGERIIAYLYLPRSGSPPYPTIVYYPGEVGRFLHSADQYRSIHVDFVLKSGRAVAFPVFKGYFDRRDPTPLQGPNALRQRRLQVVNDLRRTVDYLATRKEVDASRLGYYGYSTGGALGPIFLVVEPRLRVGVFYLAGLGRATELPEVSPLTFLPRVTVPVLMLSGELDSVFPFETSARPFFQLLGTREKKHVVAAGGHFVPRPVLIGEMLDWLDGQLGPVDHQR
jgi:serine/threonine protein kinase/dienelactone hydrolase